MNNLRKLRLEIHNSKKLVEIETEHTTTDQELYKLKSEYNKLKYEMDNFDLGSVEMEVLFEELTNQRIEMDELDFSLKSQRELLRQKMEELQNHFKQMDELEELLIGLQDEQELINVLKTQETIRIYDNMITDLALYKQGVRERVRFLKTDHMHNKLFGYENTSEYFIEP
eukprot:UN13085